MKLLNNAIVFGICTVTAAGLSGLKVNKNLVFWSIAFLVGEGLMIALRDEDNLKKHQKNYEYFFNRVRDKFEVALQK